MSIMIGVPTMEHARYTDFYDYLDALDKPVGSFIYRAHTNSSSRGRNMIIKEALARNCSHILFLDDDMVFPPHLLTQLLSHKKDIITGLCLLRYFPHRTSLFDELRDDGMAKWHFLSSEDNGLQETAGCGSACILVNTNVFKKMKELEYDFGQEKWFTLGEIEKDNWCDDVTFCIRARKAGFKFYVDFDLLVGHHVDSIVTPYRGSDGQWYTSYGKDEIHFCIPTISKRC